jgi:hypothetical protein
LVNQALNVFVGSEIFGLLGEVWTEIEFQPKNEDRNHHTASGNATQKPTPERIGHAHSLQHREMMQGGASGNGQWLSL